MHAEAAAAMQIPVTAQNRQEYVTLYTQWLLTKSIASQFSAFHKGFHNVRPSCSLTSLCARWRTRLHRQ